MAGPLETFGPLVVSSVRAGDLARGCGPHYASGSATVCEVPAPLKGRLRPRVALFEAPGKSRQGDSRGDVAQLGEHRLCKPGVEGSSPFVSTLRHPLTVDVGGCFLLSASTRTATRRGSLRGCRSTAVLPACDPECPRLSVSGACFGANRQRWESSVPVAFMAAGRLRCAPSSRNPGTLGVRVRKDSVHRSPVAQHRLTLPGADFFVLAANRNH